MSQTPAPGFTKVDGISVDWNPDDHSLHTEAEYHYPGYDNPVHNVLDLAGWQFDYYVGELQKLQGAVLITGTDALTVAENVAHVQHDFWYGKAMPEPKTPPQSHITGTAPDLTA